jgi:hypothetical protein
MLRARAKSLPKINKSHITQRLVNELFLGSMEIENAAKHMLQKYLLEKCSYTSDERKKLLVECRKSYRMLPLAANHGPSESRPSYGNQLRADGTVDLRFVEKKTSLNYFSYLLNHIPFFYMPLFFFHMRLCNQNTKL